MMEKTNEIKRHLHGKTYMRGSEAGVEVYPVDTVALIRNLSRSCFREEFKAILKEVLSDEPKTEDG